MPDGQMLPLLLSILISLTIGFIVWGLFRAREQPSSNALGAKRDEIMLGLLVLAAFASGMFAAIILLTVWK